MEATVKFDQAYFDKILEGSAKEGINKKKAEKVLTRLSKSSLVKLFQTTGSDFYKTLLFKLGTLRFENLKDKNLNKGIDELKKATGLDGKELQQYFDSLDNEEETPLKGINSIKLICGKLLGFLKVCWDTTIIGLGFTTRVSVRLVVNIAKALKDTGVYAKDEAISAGGAIKDSWNRNM